MLHAQQFIEKLRALTDLSSLREIDGESLFDVFFQFLSSKEVNEDDKVSIILLCFHVQVEHPLLSAVHHLEPRHHEQLSRLVYLTDEVLEEQSREELAEFVVLTTLIASFRLLLKKNAVDKRNQEVTRLLGDFFENVATFRSFYRIVHVLRYHQELITSIVATLGIAKPLLSMETIDASLKDQIKNMFQNNTLLIDFLTAEPLLRTLSTGIISPLHPFWYHSAVEGLFDILSSEDQMAFLSLFTHKWLYLYQESEITPFPILESIIRGFTKLKDVPISILEDVLVTIYHLGDELLRHQICQVGWEQYQLRPIKDLFNAKTL